MFLSSREILSTYFPLRAKTLSQILKNFQVANYNYILSI